MNKESLKRIHVAFPSAKVVTFNNAMDGEVEYVAINKTTSIVKEKHWHLDIDDHMSMKFNILDNLLETLKVIAADKKRTKYKETMQ